MRIYYLDEALNNEELTFVKDAIVQREGLGAIQSLEQVRIPTVLPTPSIEGQFQESIEEQIYMLYKNLKNAGIEKDVDKQITFVMPKEAHWGVKIQMAIVELTGFAPYVVQRWSVDDKGKTVRRDIRLIDAHGMFGCKG